MWTTVAKVSMKTNKSQQIGKRYIPTKKNPNECDDVWLRCTLNKKLILNTKM